MAFPRHSFKKAWEWRAKLDSKEISAKELTQEYLLRARADKTNSFITLTEDLAKSAAEKIQNMSSTFSGIPIAIKDVLTTEGILTTCGSKILSSYSAPYNATVVEKLQAAGAVSLGKLNMDEFAMGSSNENSAYGAVSLPQDLTRVPGGSSGGSAAAVAGNLVVATLGTDTGGSVRQPASFCGVVGIKPTYGRVSRYGLIAFASSLDQVGPLSLDVQDGADLLELIAGFDERDSTTAKTSVPKYGKAVQDIRTDSGTRKNFLKNLRVGIARDLWKDGLEPEVQKATEEAIQNLEKNGAKIIDVKLPHARYAISVYYLVAVSEASSNLARFDGVRYGPRVLPHGDKTSLEEMYEATRGELFGVEVKRRILLGTFALSSGYYDAYYRKACQARRLITEDFLTAFSECDVFLGPTTPTVAFKRGEKISDPLQMYLNDVFTVPINLAGVPAVSLPWGEGKNNLPIGMQLVAPHFAEEDMLKAAAAMEILYDER